MISPLRGKYMFCYTCGSQLYNGMTKCPFCNADMQVVDELIFDSTVRKLMPLCPPYNVNVEQSFHVGSHVISVPKTYGAMIALNNLQISSLKTHGMT